MIKVNIIFCTIKCDLETRCELTLSLRSLILCASVNGIAIDIMTKTTWH